MNRLAGRAFKIMIAGLLAGVLLGLVAPRALGFVSPADLWTTTHFNSSLDVKNLVPGDAVKLNVEIGNNGVQPVYYQIVFVKRGVIWSCDAVGHHLDYQLDWNQGADRYLQPGEVEMVDIEVALPLSAQRGCMGQSGTLAIRRGTVAEEREAGIYDCMILSVFGINETDTAGSSTPRGTICYRPGMLLDLMINPYRRH